MSMDGDAVDLGRTGYIDSMSRRALSAAIADGERVRDSKCDVETYYLLQ